MSKKKSTIKTEVKQLSFNSNDMDNDVAIMIKAIPKLAKKDAEELLCIKSINANCDPPETYSEMKESAKMANWFYKKLDKFPKLRELGFDEGDVYDYTQD